LKQLIDKDPDLKIVVHNSPRRTYKGLFFDMFKIPIERIVYVDNCTIPPNNICWATNNICLNTQSEGLCEPFTILMTQFYQEIMSQRVWNRTQSITHLLLPR